MEQEYHIEIISPRYHKLIALGTIIDIPRFTIYIIGDSIEVLKTNSYHEFRLKLQLLNLKPSSIRMVRDENKKTIKVVFISAFVSV